MKNIIKGFLLSVAAITLFAGCAQENFSAPKGKSMVFTATIADATRTAIVADGTAGKVNWVAGDEITINGVAYVATPDADDATKATFTKKDEAAADPESVDGKYYAAYACTFDAANGEGVLDAEQAYAEGSLANAPMYAESTTTALSFKNICGLLEITLKGTDAVSSVAVSADNLGMSGAFTVSDGQTAVVKDNGIKKVTLACGDGATLTSDGVKFYVAVPAGEYEGLTIAVKTTDSKAWTKTAVNKAVVAANTIYPLTFTPEFKSDVVRYSNDGGANWTPAESLAAAMTATAGTSTDDCIIELLNDNELSGELPDIAGKKFTVKGNGFTVDVSKRTVRIGTSSATEVIFDNVVFDGKSAKADSRLAYNLGTMTFRNGEWKDIIFDYSSTGKAAIILNEGTLNFDSEYVHDCYTATSGSVYGGIVSNYGGTLNVTNSTFDTIESQGTGDSVRGALVYNTSKGSTVIKGSTFTNALAGHGGVIYLYSGSLAIEDSEISDCTAISSGGAIYAYDGTIELKNTTFENCTCSSNGGALYNCAATTIEGCTFTGCKAVYGGALDNRKTLNFNGGTITECSASTWGGGIYNTSSATCDFNGGTIKDCSGNYGGCISINTGVVNINGGALEMNGGKSYVVAKTSNSSVATINVNGGVIKSENSRALSMASKKGTININGGSISTGNADVVSVYSGFGTLNICQAKADVPTEISAVGVAVYSKTDTLNVSGGRIVSSGNDGIDIYADSASVTKFNMTGGEIEAPKGYGIYVYKNKEFASPDTKAQKVIFGISDCKITSSLYSLSLGLAPEDSEFTITGGLYTKVSDTMKGKLNGYEFVDNGDGYFKVVPL